METIAVCLDGENAKVGKQAATAKGKEQPEQLDSKAVELRIEALDEE